MFLLSNEPSLSPVAMLYLGFQYRKSVPVLPHALQSCLLWQSHKASGVTMTGTPQDILNNLEERIDEQLKG